MLNLLMQQVMAILKANGFDGEQAQAQVKQAVDDIHAMKQSQDRCEAMLKAMLSAATVFPVLIEEEKGCVR